MLAASSLNVMRVRLDKVEPEYAVSTVSNELPKVSTVREPDAVALYLNQMLAPPPVPDASNVGSSGSMVATVLEPFQVPDGVSILVAPEKKSLDAVTVTALDALDAVL
ncbi:unannotated protein [freshwater metagenome]|uniref:Unannotated protein n=1 Tax=freshwater metagenome TaxID=449393 RepID=A0A6J6EXJ1_9ZZZZ